MGIHTAYKFRHWKTDPETGLRVLDWASHLDLNGEQITKGSSKELEVIEAQDWQLNALADEGEVDMLDVYFDTQAVRANLYGRLASSAPGEADNLAAISEITGSGYSEVTWARGTDWGAPTAGGGTTSTLKTFTATGTWTAATHLFIATTIAANDTGLHIAFSALSATRTLANGDTLDVTATVTLE